MLLYFASVKLFLTFSSVLSGPLVLSYGTSTDFGIVKRVAGIASAVGSLIMSAWGGPKSRKVPASYRIYRVISAAGLLISGLRPNTLAYLFGTGGAAGLYPLRSRPAQPGRLPGQNSPRCSGASFLHLCYDRSSDEPFGFRVVWPAGRSFLRTADGGRRSAGDVPRYAVGEPAPDDASG